MKCRKKNYLPYLTVAGHQKRGLRKVDLFRMFLIFVVAVVILLFGIMQRAGWAEETDEDMRKRIEELERTVQQQEEQRKATEEKLEELKKDIEVQQEKKEKEGKESIKETIREVLGELRIDYREPTPEEKRLETIYDDGFYLRGKDDTLKIGGWYQFDGRFYLDDDHPRDNTFDNRRVRLDFRGTLENYFGYRLYATLVGSPVIQEGWVEYRYFPFARLKLGQYKEPFSLESQYSARWIDFVERSMGVTALQPAEDIGVMLSGTFWDSRIIYGIGAFNGQGRDEEAVVDDKDVTGRVVLQPFRQQKDSLFEKLHIGGSFGVGNNEIDVSNRDFRTAGRTPFYDFVSTAQADGRITRYDAELEWLKGPIDLTTEFIGTNFDEVKAGSQEDKLTVNSWYITLSYVLTGEDAQRSKPIKPFRNFDVKKGGWGAFQLLGRYERFWLTSKDLIEKGIASGADGADAFSLGLNWWPNVHLKFMLNYVYTDFDQTITVSGKELDNEKVILMRAQFNL